MKSEKGVSLILLILVVLILAVVSVWGIKKIEKKVKEEQREDLATQMLSVQTLAKNIQHKHEMNAEQNALVGIKLDLNNNDTGYKVSEALKEELKKIEGADLYILTQEDMNNNKLSQIKINDTEFYIVDYNSGEVYYSLGTEGNYALKEVEVKKQNNEENATENEGIENEGVENEGTGN